MGSEQAYELIHVLREIEGTLGLGFSAIFFVLLLRVLFNK